MLCLSGFELYSRWVPLQDANEGVPTRERLFTLGSNEYEIASYSSYKGIKSPKHARIGDNGFWHTEGRYSVKKE